MKVRRVVLLAFFALFFWLSSARKAHAASYEVSPVRIALSASAPSALLKIHNTSTERVRMQVKGFAWRQQPGTDMDLSPTTDLIFFPAFLTLAPGETRAVRVGVVATDAVEHSYRVKVEELPPLANGSSSNGVRVLTHMSIPVFAQSAPAKATAVVEGASVRGRVLTFLLKNAGATWFFPKSLRVHVKDGAGREIAERDVPAWYVLAKSARAISIELPQLRCTGNAHVEVDVEGDGTRAKAALDTPCAP